MKTKRCVVCGAPVTRRRFRAAAERTACGLTCRNRLIASTRATSGPPKGQPLASGTTASHGYVYVLMPNHPRANGHGYVKRADLVLEAKLGRPLAPNEIAHHENEVTTDDAPGNLLPMDRGDHQRLHTAKRTAAGAYKRRFRAEKESR